MLAVGTPEQEARTLLAIEAFVGMRSPEPRVARYFNERRRLTQITNPITSDEVKRFLVAEGPRCAPEDEAYVLGTPASLQRGGPNSYSMSGATLRRGRDDDCR